MAYPAPQYDLTGQRFFRLLVKSYSHRNKHNKTVWNCICDCGVKKQVAYNDLKTGDIKSCGCYQKERLKTHGLTKTPLHKIHAGILTRCYNPNSKLHKNYGGRGITMCDEWLNNLKSFVDWAMANGYRKGLSIDRINNDNGYNPENCRWSTFIEQNNNRRSSHLFTLNGECKTITQWSRIYKINKDRIFSRINMGWDIEKAITTPIDPLVKYTATIDGVKLPVAQWCKKLKVNYDMVKYRIKNGWSPEKAIITPSMSKNTCPKMA